MSPVSPVREDPVDRLLAEAAHLPPVDDPGLDGLRWAVLVEDALGVTLSDAQITAGISSRPSDLRALVAAQPTVS